MHGIIVDLSDSLICLLHAGGDLEDHFKHRTEPLSTTHILAYAKQLLDGLWALHRSKEMNPDAKNAIHGDIKPKNLFLCDYRHGIGYMTIKIGDHDDPGHMDKSVTTAELGCQTFTRNTAVHVTRTNSQA